MKGKMKVLSAALVIVMCLCICTAFAVFVNAADTVQTVGAMIEIEENLSKYRLGDVQYVSSDGYIGIPIQISVYHNGEGTVTAGVGGTPLIIYVVNTNTERAGTDSDTEIITSMLERGYLVAVVDYLNNERAVSPAIDWSICDLRFAIQNGSYFSGMDIPTSGYLETYVVPAGHNISLGNAYWEIDKHSTAGTLEYIVEVWNEDFRSVYAERVIKWIDSDGNRKSTQNGYDGTAPVWLDSDGSENENGEYIKAKHTLAVDIEDCVKPDGSPLEYSLFMNIIYPTNPEKDVPVMCLAASGDHLASAVGSSGRPQFYGFIFNGYAGVAYDYGYTPMARKDAYGEFSGNSNGGITGDNVTYSICFYNDKGINTAAMRYLRYLAASGELAIDTEAIGVYGNSKGGWMTYLGEEHPELLGEKRYFPGHHGETRYEAGETESSASGVIDGGEEQPWLTYNGVTLDSGADLIYASCGGSDDQITEGHAPMFVSCNLGDPSYYDMSNKFVNLCRNHDVPCMWYEVNLGHTFTYGEDMNWGVDTYDSLFRFADYYLKGEAVCVEYTSFTKGSADFPIGEDIVVKFTGAVSEDNLQYITVTDASGVEIAGSWTRAFGDTEWTFRPDSALSAGAQYTLTVGSELSGDNGLAIGEDYTVDFTVKSEDSVAVSYVDGSLGRYYYYTLTDSAVGSDKYLLRFSVSNDASNLVEVYPITTFNESSPDSSVLYSEPIALCGINGSGVYECDVTDYVSTLERGDVAAFLLKTAREEGTSVIYSHTFDSSATVGLGSITYSISSEIEGTEGDGALKISGFGTKVSSGTVANVEYYVNPTNAIYTSIIKSGSLTSEDVGRTFTVSFRIYDTVSRRVQVYLRSATSSSYGTADYNAARYNLTTVAGEWVEFSFDYTVYEPEEFGAAGRISKYLYIDAETLGDTGAEYPLYIDSLKSVETVSAVSLAEEAALIFAEQEVDPLETPYGRLDKAYEDATVYPVVIFLKNGDSYTFKAASSTIPTSFNYGSDAVVYLRGDVALTSSRYNLDTIGSGNELILDLGGYTLDLTSAGQYYPLYSAASSSFTFTMKNGKVYSNGKAPLVGIDVKGNNSVRLNYENLDITLGSSFGNTSALVGHVYSDSCDYVANYDIVFTDCSIDVSACNSSSLYVIRAGYSSSVGQYSLSWTFNGGSLNTGSSEFYPNNLCVQKGGSLRLGAGTDGEYTKLILTADTSITTAFTDTDGSTRYFGATATDGTNYIHQPLLLTTEYGTIPQAYASALKYPFVGFANGSAQKYGDFFDATSIEYGLRSYDGAVVLLRRDYTVSSNAKYQNLSHHQGEIILDLDGYTLDGRSGYAYGIFNATGFNTFETELTVRNGKILLSGPLFAVATASGVENKSQIFNAQNLEIVSSGAKLVNYSALVTAGTASFNYENCSIDMSEASSNTDIFRSGYAANSLLTTTVTVKGGTVRTSAAYHDKMFYALAGSELIFAKGTDGGYTEIYLPTGSTVSGTAFSDEDGSNVYLVEQENGAAYDLYMPESLVTPYGTIDYANSSRADYPFLAFCDNGDGTYTYITKNANFFANGGMEYTLRSYESAVVLLRRDFTVTGYISNLSNRSGTLTMDLDGYTLTVGGSNPAISSDAKHATETKVIFKNGGIVLDSAAFIRLNSSVAGKVFDYTFSDLVISYAEGTAVKSFLTFGSIAAQSTVGICLDGCTLDMTSAPSGAVLLPLTDSTGLTDLSVSIKGGNLIADELTADNVTDARDELLLELGDDGELMTLTLPVGVSAPSEAFTTEFGEMTFVKMGAGEGTSVWYLRDRSRLVSPSGSLTLYSDFIYNVYVPVNDSVLSITLDGVRYDDLSSLEVVNVGGTDYYRLTKRIPVCGACEEFTLSIEMEVFTGKTQSASWSIGIVSYAGRLIDGDYSETVKTLARDILSYIRAAYAYEDSIAEEIAELDAIIGENYDDSSVPDTDVEAVYGISGLSSACLELGEAPAFRFYLDGSYDPSLYSFSVNGKRVAAEAVTDTDGRTFIRVSMYAYAMTDTVSYTVEGTDISGEYNLRSYYDFALDENDDALTSLVERLWKYSESAKAYRAEVNG